jgi:hypothetical protein
VRKRLSRALRREQLLGIMRELFAGASTPAEFTAGAIADAAGVSSVLVYRVIGVEFRELRGSLEGIRRAPGTEAKLRREIETLRRENRELKSSRKIAEGKEIAAAHELIEEQDEEIRRLCGRVELLEQRLKERETVVIEIPIGESKKGVGQRKPNNVKQGGR